jgi:hypothetical protein
MVSPIRIRQQLTTLTSDLIGLSLCDSQNFPSIKSLPQHVVEVGLSNSFDLSVVLKNIKYEVVYAELQKTQAYNFKMLDGALIQLMYRYRNGNIEAHRLAFFPSPSLEEFQNNPEIYMEDLIYADVSEKNIVTFPIRFDFDSREETSIPIKHPKSHLTLGQYKNCRIPVNSALTPFEFLTFILRNFYNTAYAEFNTQITQFDDKFDSSLFEEETVISRLIIAK